MTISALQQTDVMGANCLSPVDVMQLDGVVDAIQ